MRTEKQRASTNIVIAGRPKPPAPMVTKWDKGSRQDKGMDTNTVFKMDRLPNGPYVNRVDKVNSMYAPDVNELNKHDYAQQVYNDLSNAAVKLRKKNFGQ